MKKLLGVFIVLFLFVNFSSAIKISPTQTLLYINQYKTNCTNIWILPESNYLISSKWSNDGNGNLSKYILNSDKIKLEINYTYVSDGKYEFCFTPSRGGNFSGIIYFYSEKNMVEIGSWVDLKVDGVGLPERISLITGNAIKNENGLAVSLSVVFVLLIIIFILVVRNIATSTLKNKHTKIDYST